MTHVPYKGTNEAIGDLMTGRISLLFAALPVVSAHIRDGRLKALGITTGQRSDLAPEIPTIAESGLPGLDVLLWFGLAAPRGTPTPRFVPSPRRSKASRRRTNAQAPRHRRCQRPGTDAGRFRSVHRRRHSEMGQGGRAFRPEDRLARSNTRCCANMFHNLSFCESVLILIFRCTGIGGA